MQFWVGSCKGRLLSQRVKLGLLFLTPGTKLHQLKTLGCVPMNTSSFSWLPLVGVWRDANWLYGCDETHFARRACFRSYHEFVADSIHSDRYKRLDVNLVRNPHKTTTDKVAVGLVCRCRWRRSCRSLLLSIVHASFVNCTFLRSPCMLQHAFIHFIINSMSHSLRLPSNLSIHPSFHWSDLFTNNCLLICRLTRRDHHHSSVHQHRSLIEINSHHLKQLLWSSDFRTRFNSLTVDDGEHNDNDE